MTNVDVTFSVPWVHGLQRPRFNGHAYDTARNRADKAEIAMAYRNACRAAGVSKMMADKGTPVSISIYTMRQLPKTRPAKVQSEPDTIKPDLDNVIKLVLDGLNGVAYADDSQVTCIHCVKHERMRYKQTVMEVSVNWEES